MSRWTLADISRKSAAIQAQVYGVPPHVVAQMDETSPAPQKPAKRAKQMIRQNSAALNKTEQAFKDYLTPRHFPILCQAVTLKIGNGVRYTPDFFCPKDATNGHEAAVTECVAYEVKGFMRDDAAVKLKVAASLYPWIKFHLVSRKKGEWIVQEILP